MPPKDHMKLVDRVKYTQDFFRFAYRIGLPLGKGQEVDLPVPPRLVTFGKHSLVANDFELTDEAIKLCGVILELLAYRLLAMELDSALEQTFGQARLSHKDKFTQF